MGLELVVSRYSESTDWLMQEPFKSHAQVVYNKGDSPLSWAGPRVRQETLPNVGREGHTFLHHIVSKYDSLADVTVFLPASCTDAHKISKTRRVIELAHQSGDTVFIGQRYRDVRKELWNFGPEKWGGTNESNRATMNTHDRMMVLSEHRPFGRWFEHYFGQQQIKVISWMGIFAVSRAHIRQHPKRHYTTLMETVAGCINPQAGHFLERSWAAVFHPFPETCVHYPMAPTDMSVVRTDAGASSSSSSSSSSLLHGTDGGGSGRITLGGGKFTDMLARFKTSRSLKTAKNKCEHSDKGKELSVGAVSRGGGTGVHSDAPRNKRQATDGGYDERHRAKRSAGESTYGDNCSNSSSSSGDSGSSNGHGQPSFINYIILGVQKGGTMAAVKNLNRHPDVFCLKEPHFFDMAHKWQLGVKWYKSELQRQNTARKPIVGEKTPELIYVEDSLARIKNVCPDVKFILFLRCPVKRAFSNWSMMVGKGQEDATFDECVERELSTQMSERRSYGTSEYHYVQKGFYMDQIERFLKRFPDAVSDGKLLVVISERVRSSAQEQYDRIFAHIGAAPFRFEATEEYVGSYTGIAATGMSERVRKRLAGVFAKHNRRLFDWLGYDVPEWVSSE